MNQIINIKKELRSKANSAKAKILQGFFKGYLNVQYAFTLQELKTELETKFMSSDVKEQICAYVDEYTQDQFGAPQQLTQERLRHYLDRFVLLLDALNPKQDSRTEPSVERLAQKLMAITPTRAARELFSGRTDKQASSPDTRQQPLAAVPTALAVAPAVQSSHEHQRRQQPRVHHLPIHRLRKRRLLGRKRSDTRLDLRTRQA